MNTMTQIDTGAKARAPSPSFSIASAPLSCATARLRLPQRRARPDEAQAGAARARGGLRGGARSRFRPQVTEETMLLDIGSTVDTINYLHSNLAPLHAARAAQHGDGLPSRLEPRHLSAARRRRHHLALELSGRRSRSLPLATAIAAGNRVMLKPSEFTPATTGLLASMLAETFDEDQVAVVTGDAKVGAEFTSLPFDHLLFTGSTPVGTPVMRAASDNLVPVTLELGGKSPVIVDRGYSIETAALPHRLRQACQWRPDLRRTRLCARARGRARCLRRRVRAEADSSIPTSRPIPIIPGSSTTIISRG